MRTDTPVAIHLKDYTAPAYSVSNVELFVELDPVATTVRSVLHVTKGSGLGHFVLDGENLDLLSITCNGHRLDGEDWTVAQDKLTLKNVPQHDFTLDIQQQCNPSGNTVLSGLYVSNGVYCTQMEAEGFRRFAFMQDRPDVMATYRVHITAPDTIPVLLSNGNLIEQGAVAGTNKHFAIWEDPHPKPTYLFALVAGDLASVHDTFTTVTGRAVSLGIFVEHGKEDRCAWAMQSLKTSMLWDEKRFGRVYDLDVFNIVAVSDFNMGAMENKGLNIFNDKYILARADTATDTDYVNIERIIAHEYFHNWTGNRITCRDWFQLCLKEGLTVYRDQEFTADVRSRAVKRIEDVKTLRARQFPEDQGPLAHAVRPSSYIEINNFYTPTIYEKGAEICRMLHTLLGAEKFGLALDLYFERHDGDAATVEDFLACMADASGRDLTQFAIWYRQAGTPIVRVTSAYDATAQEFRVDLSQHTPPTPQQPEKAALHMPLALALLAENGVELTLQTRENIALRDGIFEFDTAEARLTFHGISEKPVLSFNRGFSAPIIIQNDTSNDDLLRQMAVDRDLFNRWEATQTCGRRFLVQAYHGAPLSLEPFADSLVKTIADKELDLSFKALMLQLPSEADLTVEIETNVDASQIRKARHQVLAKTAERLTQPLLNLLAEAPLEAEYHPDVTGCGKRSLRSAALSLLAHASPRIAMDIAQQDFAVATNMTTELSAVSSVLNIADAAVDQMLDVFYARHSGDHLLVDKWFMLMAARARSAQNIEALTAHAAFTFKNPNRVYALIGGFTGGNLSGFHAADGGGYQLLRKVIVTLNGINPQVAARMANSFRSWGRYDDVRQQFAELEMRKILEHPQLSNDVFEIISRTLNG